MEHLDDDSQLAFMKKAASILMNNGLMIALVPASPAHWGIEDGIAGHYRRYTKNNIENLLDDIKKKYIISALEKSNNNKNKATKLLGLSNYQTLSNWIEKLNIK
mgnify:CR=1 FL=1